MTLATYVGNGASREFDITFPYRIASSIKVSVDGAPETFTFVTPSRVSLTNIPASGSEVRIYRQTDVSAPERTFSDGSIMHGRDLNVAVSQPRERTEELGAELADVADRAVKSAPGEIGPTLPRKSELQGKFLVGDANGNLIPSFGTGVDLGLRQDLISSTGAQIISVLMATTGVPRSLQTVLRERASVTPADFGVVDPTGVVNSTTAMKAFFDYCIATGSRGKIPPGDYKMTPGVLFFDNGGVDRAFPEIETAGWSSTIFRFDPASTVDAPMIVITNGRAGSANPGGNWTGGDGKYWEGGGIGGLSIIDTTSATGTRPNRHGMELQGWINPRMGFLYYVSYNNGAAVFLPRAEYDGASPPAFNAAGSTNPDPCAVSDMQWAGIECAYSTNLIRNDNGVGMDGWKVSYVRAIQTYGDCITDVGQGCQFPSGSFGGCNGWVMRVGMKVTVNRLIVENWEVDNCKDAFDLRRVTDSTITRVRINHRYNSPANIHNNGEGFWPRIAYRFAHGASGIVVNVTVDKAIHRIQPLEAGVNPAGKNGGPAFGVNAMGTLLFTDAPGSVSHLIYDHNFQNSAGFVLPKKDFHSGWNGNSRVRFSDRGVPFVNYMYGNEAVVSYTGTAPALASGGAFTDPATRIPFNSARIDQSGNYDTASGLWVAPYTGWCVVEAALDLTLAVGTRVRMAVVKDSAGNGTFSVTGATMRAHAGSTEVQSYFLPGQAFQVNAGDRVGVAAIVTGGGSPTPEISAAQSCWARYRMVGE